VKGDLVRKEVRVVGAEADILVDSNNCFDAVGMGLLFRREEEEDVDIDV